MQQSRFDMELWDRLSLYEPYAFPQADRVIELLQIRVAQLQEHVVWCSICGGYRGKAEETETSFKCGGCGTRMKEPF